MRARVAVIASRDRVAVPIVEALQRSADVERCERVPHEPHAIDAAALGSYDTIVYSPPAAGGTSAAPDVVAARALCERLASLSVRHAVVISSAAIYPPGHENPGRLQESAFIPPGRNTVADGWRVVERLGALLGADSDAAPPVRTALRPAAVLDGSDYFSRLLTGFAALTYPGHDPTLQFLSPRDLADAVVAVVGKRPEGIFNVAPAAAIPLRAALRMAGVTRVPVGRVAQTVVRKMSSPARVMASADQLEYIQYSWTVSGDKLRREVGFAPSDSSADAIAALTGRPANAGRQFDEFGMDPDYIRRYCGHLFRFLHDYYWRVEIDGIEEVPKDGRGVLVGVHRGFMPFDGVMALFALVTRRNRIPRFLIHPSLTKFPFLADFMAKLGGVMACQENGDYVLERDELLGVFPEGIRGAFTMYDRAYRIGRFGRDEFVRMALRNRAPLLPFVTVGSAEIYPILGRVDWSWFKRYTEWPFLPITASPVPLPSKWHTRFLPAIHVEKRYPPEAADDPALVHQISLDVRQRMQSAIDEMLRRRRSVFFGSIFDRVPPADAEKAASL